MAMDPDRNIALFLGAGASATVGLPTVCNFFGKVLFPTGAGYKSGCETLAGGILAAEQANVAADLLKFDAEKLFERLAELVKVDVKNSFRTREGLEITTVDLFDFLKGELVRVYGHTTGLLSALYPHIELLKFANEIQPERNPLVIFTTNYDRLVESAIMSEFGANEAFAPFRPVLRTGFTAERPGRWNPASFQGSPQPPERHIHLVKLHGSVTWKWQQFGEVREPVETGWSESAGPLDCVLHFGYKEIPESEPFKTLHDKLEDVLRAQGPRAIIAIGYRFGDPFIRKALGSALRANPDLHVLLCLTRMPDYQTPLGKLMDTFPKQLSLVRDQDGKPIPFGKDGFTKGLRSAVETTFSR